MKKNKARLPHGWTQAKIDRLLRYHENQTDEQAIAEVNRAFDNQDTTMTVPRALVPVVESLISRYQNRRTARRR